MSPDEWSAWASWASIVVVLGIAVVGWSHARRANVGAKVANEHASQALELAKSAEARADRLERIALERRDVTWEQLKGSRETLTFKNVGSDTAHDVVLMVDPAGGEPRRTAQHASVEPAGQIDIELKDLADVARRRMENAGPGVFLSPNYSVRARLTWCSESGVSSTQEFEKVVL